MTRNLLIGVTVVLLAWTGAGSAEPEEKPILVLDARGHTAVVRKVVFTPDGKEVITVSDDKTIRCWDAATGETLRVLRPPIAKGPQGMLYAVALSPDGKTLAVGGYGFQGGDHPIYLLDFDTRQVERRLAGHDNAVTDLAFSRDGQRLVSGSTDSTAKVWNVRSGKCLHVLKGHEGAVYGVAISSDGRRVATGSLDRTARIWSVEEGACQTELRGHEKEILCVAWRPDGEMLATGGQDRVVRLWSQDGKLLRVSEELPNHVTSLAFHPTKTWLLATTGGGKGGAECCVLDTSTGKSLHGFYWHSNTVQAGQFSPDGQRVASAGGHWGECFIWSAKGGSPLAILEGKGQTPFGAGWSPDGKSISWTNTNEGMKEPNAANPLNRTFLPGDLAFGPAPDKSFLRARTERGSVSLVPGKSPEEVHVRQEGRPVVSLSQKSRSGYVRCFTLLPDDRAAVGDDLGLYLYDTRSGELVRRFVGNQGLITAVAPSPDGGYFLSTSFDQTLRIWVPEREEPLLSLFIAENEWVAWTREGYYACSAGGERLFGWQVNQGKDKLAKFYPAAQFRETYYRPDVIKLLLRTGSVDRALEEADKASGKKTEKTTIGHVLPPSVIVVSPKPLAKLSETQAKVEAVAHSVGDHPVSALRLLVDGRPTGRVLEIVKPKLGQVSAEWTIDLPPGEHTLQVLADSAVSTGESDPVTVIRPKEEKRLPRLIVLAVGVGSFSDKDVRTLPKAGSDALAVEKAFATHSKDKRLFGEVVVKSVTDDKAGRRDVLKALRWFSEEMTSEDVGVFFFAGHGKRDKAGQLYLFGHDVDPRELVETGIPGSQLKATLAGTKGRLVLLLDACYAGALNEVERADRDSLNEELARDLGRIENGLAVLCSSRGNEESKEDVRNGGFFTQALVEGLSGKAHLVEGAVYLSHLQAYLSDRVKSLSKNEQTPTFNVPPGITRLPLSRPSP